MVNTIERRRRAGGERRQRVRDAVVEVLAERGYQGTRFRDVAAASGVAVSTLQTYFGSREDMLVEALCEATEAEAAALREAADAVPDPWERLVRLIDRGLATPVPVWRTLMEFWTAAAHDAELRAHSLTLQRAYREPFERVIGDGLASGAFRAGHDASVVTDLIVACLDGLLYPRVLGQPHPRTGPLRELLLDQLRHTLGVAQ
ncbi:TetR/AcrR family transcriptional regulator [Streptomyces sp. PT12]|uniref:TetR/AcrR family transcriptional regulator n=1 Tax=Streptomyces sp. PT12 TaxID=1510197 RepID=UPI001C67EAB5|nr:TetR/AcrR family transcriptional regulator [Streptomyces sp. PT12]